MSNNSDSNSDSENENKSITESEQSTLIDNSDSDSNSDSDDDEVFIRIDSTTNYDLVDYIMIGSTCYAYSNSDTEENTVSQYNSECLHNVLVYFINGYIDQQIMAKQDIIDLFQLQGIDLRGNDVFEHLLE